MKKSKFTFLLLLIAIASLITSVNKVVTSYGILDEEIKQATSGNYKYNYICTLAPEEKISYDKLYNLLKKNLSNYSVELSLSYESPHFNSDYINIRGILNNKTYLGTLKEGSIDNFNKPFFAFVGEDTDSWYQKHIQLDNDAYEINATYYNKYRSSIYFSLHSAPKEFKKAFESQPIISLSVRGSSSLPDSIKAFEKDLKSTFKNLKFDYSFYGEDYYKFKANQVKTPYIDRLIPYVVLLIFSIALVSILISKIFFRAKPIVLLSLFFIMLTCNGYILISSLTYLNARVQFTKTVEEYKDNHIYYSSAPLTDDVKNRIVSSTSTLNYTGSFSTTLSYDKVVQLEDELNFTEDYNSSNLENEISTKMLYFPQEFYNSLSVKLSKGSNLDFNKNTVLLGDTFEKYFNLGDTIYINGNKFEIVGFIEKNYMAPYTLGRLTNLNNGLMISSPLSTDNATDDLFLLNTDTNSSRLSSIHDINTSLIYSYGQGKFVSILFSVVTLILLLITISVCYVNLFISLSNVIFFIVSIISNILSISLFYFINISSSLPYYLRPIESLEYLSRRDITITFLVSLCIFMFQYIYKKYSRILNKILNNVTHKCHRSIIK